jgi:hypothetical protein
MPVGKLRLCVLVMLQLDQLTFFFGELIKTPYAVSLSVCKASAELVGLVFKRYVLYVLVSQ